MSDDDYYEPADQCGDMDEIMWAAGMTALWIALLIVAVKAGG